MRRRAPFIQVLAPAAALFGIAACTGGGKRHDDGSSDEGITDLDERDSGEEEETGDTGAE